MPSKPPAPLPPQVPGPGTYSTDKLKAAGHSKASIVIGTGPKLAEDLTTSKIVPGPGTYKLQPRLNHIGGAIGNESKFPKDRSTRTIVPGPGAYGAKDTFEKTGTKFGNDSRIKYEASLVPGPGQYKIVSSFDPRKH
jgi:hypothetical protein